MTRDRRSLPLQVRDQILALIKREDLGPGDQLPTEAEIAASFDVARTTAREAFKLLEQDGVVDVRHGLGRYVSQLVTLERSITSLESVTEMMRSRGYAVTNRVVSVSVGPANDQEATALDQPVGTQVIRLERVRLQHGDPLIYSVDVVPRALIDAPLDQEDWSGSLLDTLESRGVRVVSAAAQIQATRLPPEARLALGPDLADPNGPWILLVQRHLDEAGRPVIYSQDYHRGDRFTFNVVRRRRE
jgi:GntR family transcriptional regulator